MRDRQMNKPFDESTRFLPLKVLLVTGAALTAVMGASFALQGTRDLPRDDKSPVDRATTVGTQPAIGEASDRSSLTRATARWETDYFRFDGPRAIRMEGLADIALAAMDRACALLSIRAPPLGSKKLRVYVADSAAEVGDIMAADGLSYVAPESPGYRVSKFHPDLEAVSIVCKPSNRPVVLAHEVVHWVVSWLMPKSPRTMDEGLAEFVASEVVRARADCAAAYESLTGDRRISLARIVNDRSMPDVDELFLLESSRFDADRDYDLSWCFAKALAQHELVVPGSLRRLCDRLNGLPREEWWDAFGEIYPIGEFERAWEREVRAEAEIGRQLRAERDMRRAEEFIRKCRELESQSGQDR